MKPKNLEPADNASTPVAGNANPAQSLNGGIIAETATVSQGGRASINPREILAARLPAFSQGFITYLSGVALPGQKLRRRSSLGRALQSFGLFFGGLAAGIAAAHGGHFVALGGAWLITLIGARELHLPVLHHSSQGTVGSKRWSAFLGRAASVLAIEMALPEYREGHKLHHRRSVTSTYGDETVRFLLKIGISPGLSVAENRRRFLKALVSPARVWWQFRSRVKSQLRGDLATRTAFFSYLAALVTLASVSGWWAEIALAWAVPVVILSYQAKAAMLIVEHWWRPAGTAPRDAVTDFAVRCAVLPPKDWTLRSSVRWFSEMGLNVLIRTAVLASDMVNHPLHHAKPSEGDWANHIQANAEWAAEREAKGLPPIPEAWGYLQALDMALLSFERASEESLQERPRARTATN